MRWPAAVVVPFSDFVDPEDRAAIAAVNIALLVGGRAWGDRMEATTTPTILVRIRR